MVIPPSNVLSGKPQEKEQALSLSLAHSLGRSLAHIQGLDPFFPFFLDYHGKSCKYWENHPSNSFSHGLQKMELQIQTCS